ncbi:MAG: MBL fold metallo-hydrolase [Clostridia bacterium]|nr:MBL fold metallo-hydrolase [Clostridia bacterium]
MKPILCILMTVCLCCAHTSCGAKTEETPALRVIFLDVGEGDCTLLRTPEGDVLIDAGSESSQDTLCRKLEALGVTRLELMILTHGDEDHIGGADGVLARFPAKEIWVSRTQGSSEAYDRLKTANEKAIICRLSDHTVKTVGGVSFFAFAPLKNASTVSENDGSIVLKVTCGNASALFTGDMSASHEAMLVDFYGARHLSCDLYKVAHHGASDANSQILLEAASPAFAVISCGADNAYGHPHGEVLLRLQQIGARVYRTDLSGDITFDCDGERFFPITRN